MNGDLIVEHIEGCVECQGHSDPDRHLAHTVSTQAVSDERVFDLAMDR